MLSSEILNSAADLLEQKEWLQDYLARDHKGAIVQPEDPRACAFCMLGAIWHFTFTEIDGQLIKNDTQAAKDAVSRVLGFELNDNGQLAMYNDALARSKEEVIATLREAARQEAEAGR
jgi:hypothetical protein